MAKIIIQNDSKKITDAIALLRVLSVIEMGRISGDGDKLQYCYHTGFTDDTHVDAFRNAKSDRFVVYDYATDD